MKWGRTRSEKSGRRGENRRDRRMKKALAGPAKRTAKKKPERRAMIAARRRRAMVARVRAEAFTKAADRRLNALLLAAPRVGSWTRAADRRLNRLLIAVGPRLAGAGRRLRATALPPLRWAGRRLRPAGAFLFRRLAWLERRLLAVAARAQRTATAASAVLTPQRAICLTIAGAATCLIAAQFVEYRAVEVGQAGYAGLAALVNERRRGLGRIVFALGLLSLAVILIVDLPAGLDAGAEASRFSGAEAVLYDGFYAQIAAAAGLMLGGLLLSRARKPRPARTRGGRRGARTLLARKQGGQPDEGLRRPAATMRGRA